MGDDDLRAHARAILDSLIDTINLQESADVVLFTVYLTKDKWLLRRVLDRAKQILAKEDECDMDTAFKGRTDPSSNQEAAVVTEEDEDVMGGREMLEQESDLDEYLITTLRNMNEAFNTLNVIGQVLKNYPTRIELEVRKGLVAETYALGLRALSCFIKLVDVGRVELDSLTRKHLRLSGKRLRLADPDSGNQIASRLVAMCAFGIVRRTTIAIASPHLEPVLLDVGKSDKRVCMRLARTGVLLDLRLLGNAEVRSLYVDLEGNPMAQAVLRNVVIAHLRTFRALQPRRAALCSAVDVDPNMPSLFGTPDKLRRSGSS